MDPNEAYKQFMSPSTNFKQTLEHAESLYDWIENGGFEPNWSEKQRRKFFKWCSLYL